MPVQNLTQVGTSSFGATNTTTGPEFRARSFLDGQRFRELDRRQSYFDCTQHDYKRFDFDGRVISSGGGIGATQPLLSSEKMAQYIPLRSRRPSSPYRLARVIVTSFTNMVFGEGRFPHFRVEGDDQSQDYVQTLVRAMALPVKMSRARNLGGAMGSVGLSWCFREGKPRVEVHNAKFIYVHEWEDREQCIPRHVTELYQFDREEWVSEKRRYLPVRYWHRRDWTPNMDIVFKEAKVIPGQDPNWEPDLGRCQEHNDGLIHFVWIQNAPSDTVDGLPDYEGLYESFDVIDLLLSVITKGATLNLDPTLVLKMPPHQVDRMGVRKGSDNALAVGTDGEASYLELGGESLKAGIDLFNAKRRSILEVAQCVIPDPDQVTASGTSSVAMKVLYAPMLGVCDLYREQYGAAMVRLLEPMVVVARKASQSTVMLRDDTGEEQEVKQQVILPQKVTKEPKTDDDGNPTGEDSIKREDREPGEGGDIEPQWGPYFMPTPTDQQATCATLAQATGNQPFMSTQTATEIAMAAFGRDANDEASRVAAEKQQQQDQQSQMFPGAGGGGFPPGAGKGPPGAGGKPPGGGPPKPGGGKPPAGKPQQPFGADGSAKDEDERG